MVEKKSSLAQSFFDQADVFMVAVASDESVVDLNAKASGILGYEKAEIVGKNWFDVCVPEKERADARRLFQGALRGSLRHVHSEYPLITRGGVERTFNFHNVIVADEKGEAVGMLSSGDDVTYRVGLEEHAKDVENRLQISLDFMIEGCQIIDFDWRYIYINEAAARHGRKSKKELLGSTMMQVYPGIDTTEMFSNLRNCMTNRVPHQMDNEFTFEDGSKAWFELRMEPVPEGVLILSVDITRSRQVEAELTAYRSRLEQVVAQRTAECAETNEELTRKIQQVEKTEAGLELRAMILDNAQEPIFLLNMKGDFVYANGAAFAAYGYNLDEFLNMNIRALLPAKDSPSLEGLFKHILEKGGASLEMIHLRKGGSEMPVKAYSNLVKTAHGQFIVFVIRRLFRR